ncbi:MAG: hypothetical protein K9G76_09905 [Bacteroidales bacterium]|nr:hypothetical protein [Bacteroidales bacterium]MCF8404013.1 hypothetical protein [Bacteroidales bacterium]
MIETMCNQEHHKDSIKTYTEQTKLLVTLASAFIIAPAATFTLVPEANLYLLIFSELFFVLSVLSGYVVLASISGWQAINKYDVDRPATRNSSRFQITFYLIGLILFVVMIKNASINDKAEATNENKDLIIYTDEKIFELKVNQSIVIFNNDTIRTDLSTDSTTNIESINRIYIIEKKQNRCITKNIVHLADSAKCEDDSN